MGHAHPGRPWRHFLLAAAFVPALGLLIPASSAGAATAERHLSSLHVVGGPVSAGNRAIVISVDSSHNLHLEAIDTVSGKVVWQRPYSSVGVTPGVALYPTVIGTTVMDVAPDGKPTTPLVRIAAVNTTTGRTVWSNPASFVPSDAPSTCAVNTYFCIPGYNGNGSSSLVLLNPTTGAAKTLLGGPSREIGTDLYQTDNSKPTLEQISPTATVAWKATVSTIYGPGFSPDYGWIIFPVNVLNVGTIEPIVKGNGYDMSSEKTLGFNMTTGAVQWTLPDEFLCGGTIGFISSMVACHYGGSVKKPADHGKFPSYKGLTISLEGFSAESGTVTWTEPVRDVNSLVNDTGILFRDDTHLVVTAASGRQVLLDTDNGTTTPITKGEVFWCQKNPQFKVTVPKGLSSDAERSSTSLFYGCTANGKATDKVPSTTPASVGISLDGVFTWPSPDGLRSRAIGTPQSFA